MVGILRALGFFNPVAKGNEERLRLNIERIDYWRSHGALPSDRVAKLIKQWAKRGACYSFSLNCQKK